MYCTTQFTGARAPERRRSEDSAIRAHCQSLFTEQRLEKGSLDSCWHWGLPRLNPTSTAMVIIITGRWGLEAELGQVAGSTSLVAKRGRGTMRYAALAQN